MFKECCNVGVSPLGFDAAAAVLPLVLNSIGRALADARFIVYGDERAQYGMVWDYGHTLLKCNPGSTV
ncbi:hypothetical protein PIB30_047135 [Stylosanthes scabra]|uniref:Uncharacterized protein n=1 Tax=Stylosanthes scabra TaxID=79078 RepID=A0ABU6VF48_9FABA|nr:hypothetical protein [Stylosanthes scabra]